LYKLVGVVSMFWALTTNGIKSALIEKVVRINHLDLLKATDFALLLACKNNVRTEVKFTSTIC